MIDIKPHCSDSEYNFHLDNLCKDADGKSLSVGDRVVYALAQRNAGPVYIGEIVSIFLYAKPISGNLPDLNNVQCEIGIQGLKKQGYRGTKTVARRPTSIAKI